MLKQYKPYNNRPGKFYKKKRLSFKERIKAQMSKLFRKHKNIKSRGLYYFQRRARFKEIILKNSLKTGLFGFFHKWKRLKEFYKNRFLIKKYLFQSLRNFSDKKLYTLLDKVKSGKKHILRRWYLKLACRLDVSLVRLRFVPTIALAQHYIRTRRIFVNNQLVTFSQYVVSPGDFIIFKPYIGNWRNQYFKLYRKRRKSYRKISSKYWAPLLKRDNTRNLIWKSSFIRNPLLNKVFRKTVYRPSRPLPKFRFWPRKMVWYVKKRNLKRFKNLALKINNLDLFDTKFKSVFYTTRKLAKTLKLKNKLKAIKRFNKKLRAKLKIKSRKIAKRKSRRYMKRRAYAIRRFGSKTSMFNQLNKLFKKQGFKNKQPKLLVNKTYIKPGFKKQWLKQNHSVAQKNKFKKRLDKNKVQVDYNKTTNFKRTGRGNGPQVQKRYFSARRWIYNPLDYTFYVKRKKGGKLVACRLHKKKVKPTIVVMQPKSRKALYSPFYNKFNFTKNNLRSTLNFKTKFKKHLLLINKRFKKLYKYLMRRGKYAKAHKLFLATKRLYIKSALKLQVKPSKDNLVNSLQIANDFDNLLINNTLRNNYIGNVYKIFPVQKRLHYIKRIKLWKIKRPESFYGVVKKRNFLFTVRRYQELSWLQKKRYLIKFMRSLFKAPVWKQKRAWFTALNQEPFILRSLTRKNLVSGETSDKRLNAWRLAFSDVVNNRKHKYAGKLSKIALLKNNKLKNLMLLNFIKLLKAKLKIKNNYLDFIGNVYGKLTSIANKSRKFYKRWVTKLGFLRSRYGYLKAVRRDPTVAKKGITHKLKTQIPFFKGKNKNLNFGLFFPARKGEKKILAFCNNWNTKLFKTTQKEVLNNLYLNRANYILNT